MCVDGGVVLRAIRDTRWESRRADGVSNDDNSDGGELGVLTATVETN